MNPRNQSLCQFREKKSFSNYREQCQIIENRQNLNLTNGKGLLIKITLCCQLKKTLQTVVVTHRKSKSRQSTVLGGSVFFSSTQVPLIFLPYYMWYVWFYSYGHKVTVALPVLSPHFPVRKTGKGSSPHDDLHFYFLVRTFPKDSWWDLVIWPSLATRAAAKLSISLYSWNSTGK